MKNRFDDILKRRWEEIHFPVDEANRREVIELLDQEKHRKVGGIWWLGAIILVISMSGLLWWISIPDFFTKRSTEPVKTESVPDVIKDKATLEKSSSGIQAFNIQQSELNQISDNNDLTAARNGANKTIENKVDTRIVSNTSGIQNGNMITVGPAANIIDRTVGQTESEDESTTLMKNQSVENAKSESGDSGNKIEEEKDTETSEVIRLTATHDIQMPEDRNASVTPLLEATLISDLDFNREVFTLPVNPVYPKSPPVHFFAETGFGYLPPSDPDIKSGWNIKAGAGAGYKFFPKTELIISAGYLLQKHGFAFERTSTLNQPGFGARSNFHTLTADKLHSIYAIAGVQQHVRRHIIVATAGLQWIYGAQGTIVIQAEDQFETSITETTQYSWLKLSGMRRLLWNTELSYGYLITPKINFHLGLRYNFTDLKAIDPELATEYNWRGRFAPFNPSFTINYRLYGKK